MTITRHGEPHSTNHLYRVAPNHGGVYLTPEGKRLNRDHELGAGRWVLAPFFGILTNDIIYDRLAPGVLEQLKKVNPKDEATGRRKHKNFQWLTSNAGYPKLREHLGAVIAIMKR
ncbi:MAG: P63C domain-containing protein [Xanthobacteraceae bacterium]